jgi:hypothetical protein
MNYRDLNTEDIVASEGFLELAVLLAQGHGQEPKLSRDSSVGTVSRPRPPARPGPLVPAPGRRRGRRPVGPAWPGGVGSPPGPGSSGFRPCRFPVCASAPVCPVGVGAGFGAGSAAGPGAVPWSRFSPAGSPARPRPRRSRSGPACSGPVPFSRRFSARARVVRFPPVPARARPGSCCFGPAVRGRRPGGTCFCPTGLLEGS